MKRFVASTAILLAIVLLACANTKPSVPSLTAPEQTTVKATPVGMTPDYSSGAAAADAGKATEDASTTLAATAVSHDGFNPTAVVSLPLKETSQDFTPAGASGENYNSIAEQMLAVSNRYVVRRESAALTAAAQSYADYLARTRQQGHYANGSPEQRAKAAGFTGTLLTPGKSLGGGVTSYGVGEVLCFGARDIEGAFDGWLHSPGHKAALYETTYDLAGFGRNGSIFVGMFGNSKSSASAPAATAIPAARSAVSYPTCGPGGCQPAAIGPSYQYQRRGLFGRAR